MSALPLSSFCEGDTVWVKEIKGGCQVRSRLLALGLTPGCPVKIISQQSGPTRLQVRGSEITLGNGLCSNILVSNKELPSLCLCQEGSVTEKRG